MSHPRDSDTNAMLGCSGLRAELFSQTVIQSLTLNSVHWQSWGDVTSAAYSEGLHSSRAQGSHHRTC